MNQLGRLLLLSVLCLALALGVSSTVLASNGVVEFASGFQGPFGMAFDSAGNLFVANEGSDSVGTGIAQVDSAGSVSHFAYGLNGASGLAFNNSGELYVSDDSNQVFQVSLLGDLSVFIAVSGGLENPNAIAFDQSDNLYIANTNGGFISKFDASGPVVNLHLATDLHGPQALVIDDSKGVLFFSEMDGDVYQINLATEVMSLYARTFAYTRGGLAMDGGGDFYLSAFNDGYVLRIDSADQAVTTCLSGLDQPRGLAFDSIGNLYVTSYEAGVINIASACGTSEPAPPPPTSNFSARPMDDQIDGWDWWPNATITVTVDGSPAFTTGTDEWGNFNLDLLGFNLQSGHDITVTDGYATKTHNVTSLVVTAIDLSFDTVSGNTGVGSEVHVWVDNSNVWRNVVACGNAENPCVGTDPDGTWHADFGTDPGNPDDGEGTIDLAPGTSGGSQQCDAENDCTQIHWQMANPYIEARPLYEVVDGRDWQEGVGAVHLSIDDDANPLNGTLHEADGDVGYPEWDPWMTYVHFDLPIDLVPGHIITMTGGGVTKVHEVTSLQVTDVNPGNNTVSGTATVNSWVSVWIHETGEGDDVQASGGTWTAQLPDFDPGTDGAAVQWDDDGDQTWIDWRALNPTIMTQPLDNYIQGWEWPLDATVDLTINHGGDPYLASFDVIVAPWDPQQTWVWFDVPFDLAAGNTITMTDGNTTKIHEVTILQVTDVNPENNTVSGTALADSWVSVWIHETDGSDDVQASGGTWTAQLPDFSPGADGAAAQWDGDGDLTWIGWRALNPFIEAQPQDNRIHAWEWPLGATVNLTVDRDGDVYAESAEVFVDPDNPQRTRVDFNLPVNLAVGHIIMMTDGNTTKVHTVTSLTISSVDPESDTVSGTAADGSMVRVNIHGSQDPEIEVSATGGVWSVDLPGLEPGTEGYAYQWDLDGDMTWLNWWTADPRVTVSLEHDWISLNRFTPNGDVTYTIYDQEGGNALFGPVTALTDARGEGWLDSRFTDTDLIPGNFITVVDETTGAIKDLALVPINFDYIDLGTDIAEGSGEPDVPLTLNISTSYQDGFEVGTSVDSNGRWFIDLAAEGQPITQYRWADVRICDEDGDCVNSEAPRIHGASLTDNLGVDNFSSFSDVIFTIYDGDGGPVAYGPVNIQTGKDGNTGIDLWGEGFDLLPGHFITAEDTYLGRTKSLLVRAVSVDTIDTIADFTEGTAPAGERVEAYANGLFNNWWIFPITDQGGTWRADFGSQGYNITNAMWAGVWLKDNDMDFSEDYLTNPPTIQVSSADDWITGFNFTPGGRVQIDIYDLQSVLIHAAEYQAHGDATLTVDLRDQGVDIGDGFMVVATDLISGDSTNVTTSLLTFDYVNFDSDTVGGMADPGRTVIVEASYIFEYYRLETVASSNPGEWEVDFAALDPPVHITPDWTITASVLDAEGDATSAQAPELPVFTASLTGDWINGSGWSRDSGVQIWIDGDEVEYAGTDGYGGFYIEMSNVGIDLQPGMLLELVDDATGVTKSTNLAYLTIDGVDTENDLVFGGAPPEVRLSVNFGNDQFGTSFDLFSEPNDTYVADFGAHQFDLMDDMNGDVEFYDEDGDATRAEWNVANPLIEARPEEDAIEGRDWPDGAQVHVTVYMTPIPGSEVLFEATDNAGYPEWDPWTTSVWFQLDIDLHSGHFIVMTDGETTKELQVTNLQVEGVDPETNTVFGTAAPFSGVQVWIHGWDGSDVEVNADFQGNWAAQVDDVTAQDGGAAIQWDEDDDRTWIDWRVEFARFEASLTYDWIYARGFPGDVLLTFSVYEPGAEDPVFSEDILSTFDGEAWLEASDFGVDLEPGYLIEVYNGEVFKSLLLEDLEVTSFDIENDTVEGNAPAGAILRVGVGNEFEGMDIEAEAGPAGHWLADFGAEGFDIQDDMGTQAMLHDEDGDATVAEPPPPMPPELVEASITPNPVAVGASVVIDATFESFDAPIAEMRVFTDANGWQMMILDGDPEYLEVGTTALQFAEPGVYAIYVDASDAIGQSSASALAGYLAVYDLSGAFITGGGQFVPGGATSYPTDDLPDLDGETAAELGFNIRYKKGSTDIPTGHLMFQSPAGEIKLESSSFDWLAVTNAYTAKFQGTGTIEGMEGDFIFEAVIRDSDKLGGEGDDRFVIRIWPAGENPLTNAPMFSASGDVQGQIVIHDKDEPVLSLGGLFELSSFHPIEFGARNAFLMAVEQANAAGGILDAPVSIYIRDAGSGGDTPAIWSAAYDMVDNRAVHAIIGPMFSSSVQAILADVVVPSGTVMVSPSSTGTNIAEIPDNGLLFRMADAEKHYAQAGAIRACELGMERAALVMEEDNPGFAESAQYFMNAFRLCGGEVASVVAVRGDPENALREAFEGLDPAPEMVHYLGYDLGRAAEILGHSFCMADDAGTPLNDRYWSLGVDTPIPNDFAEWAVGSIPCEVDPPVGTEVLAGLEAVGRISNYDYGSEEFRSDYLARFGYESEWFANFAYDATVLAMLAAEEAGSVNSLAIRDHLHTVAEGGVPVSDFVEALDLVRQGVDIDWQGTFERSVDGFDFTYNQEFEPDGESVLPYLIKQVQLDGVMVIVGVIDPEDVRLPASEITLFIGSQGINSPDYYGIVASAHALGGILSSELDQSVSVVVPPEFEGGFHHETTKALIDGKADIALLNTFSYMQAHAEGGAEAVISSVRFGFPYYTSQILTRVGTGIESIADLEGRRLCWADPQSTSGYIVPSLMLMAEGVDPDANAQFVSGHEDVVRQIYYDQCDAGAAYVDARVPLVGELPDVFEFVQQMLISPQIPNDSFAVSGGVSTELQQTLTAALLSIAATPEGLEIIGGINGADDLVAASHAAFEDLEDLIGRSGLTIEVVLDYFR